MKIKKMLAVGAIALLTSLSATQASAITTFTVPHIAVHSVHHSKSTTPSEIRDLSEEEVLLYKVFGIAIGALGVAAVLKGGFDFYKKLANKNIPAPEHYNYSYKRLKL